jgi:hypothetical protein
MDFNATGIFNDAMSVLVDILPTNTYDIDRPDYSSQTTTSFPVARAVNMRVEPGNSKFSYDIVPGASYFTPRCNKAINLLPGDIITPRNTSGGAPVMTVQNSGDLQTTAALAMTSLCKFTKKVSDDDKYMIYTNVPFDYVDNPPAAPPTQEDNRGDIHLETAMIVIYARTVELSSGNYFIDLSTPRPYQMTIKQISNYGPLRLITLARFR